MALDPYFLQTPTPQTHLAIALAAATSCQVCLASVVSMVEPLTVEPGRHLAPRKARWMATTGSVGLVVLFALGPGTGSFYGSIREGMSFSLALLTSVGIILSPGGVRSPWRLLAAALPALAFVLLFHNGTGRLRLVALGCAVLLALTLRYQREWIKWAIVATTPLVLWWLSTSRLAFEQRLTGTTRELGDGLASMLSSTGVFADLIYAQEQGLPLGLGTSFLTPFFVPIPESWRPEWLPDALGYELVRIVAPERVGTGFSTVASVFGAWWWNFSIVGVVLAVPFIALILVVLDRSCIRNFIKATEPTSDSALGLIFWLMMVGSLGDLVWSGVHTWLTRMYARSIPLLLLAVVLWLRPRLDQGVSVPRPVSQMKSASCE